MNTHRDSGRSEPLARVLFAATVLVGALTLVKIGGFLVTAREVDGSVAKGAPSRSGPADRPDEALARERATAEQLKKKNLFVTAPPKEHPVKEVMGILGDEALIADKWYKTGDAVGDAKIVAIEPTKVRILWDGKEQAFAPIGAADSDGGPSGRRAGPGRPRQGSGRPQMVVTGAGRGGPERSGPPSLSEEERRELRERWPTMSEQERQELREKMRARAEGRRR